MAGAREQPKPQTVIPRHVGIIMDGNGRWSAQRGTDRSDGHQGGSDRVRPVVRHAAHRSIEFLSLFSFSSENWNRPPQEVEALLRLHAELLRRWRRELAEDGVCLQHLGDREGLPSWLLEELDATVAATAENKKLTLGLGLNYSGRNDIVAATRRLARAVRHHEMLPDEIGEQALAGALDSAPFPDIDLLIRTGGEQRLSNFMLWQLSYAEIVVLPCLWPEFHEAEFDQALEQYAARDRRFGRLSDSKSGRPSEG